MDEKYERYTSKWRKSSIKKICAGRVRNVARKNMVDAVYTLFCHGAARMAFLKFGQYPKDEGIEVSILSVIRIDAIAFDAVDRLNIELDRSVDYIDKNESG